MMINLLDHSFNHSIIHLIFTKSPAEHIFKILNNAVKMMMMIK